MEYDNESDGECCSLESLPPDSDIGSTTTSTRSSSPISVCSMTSSMRAEIYREEYGRGLNNCSDVYRLPGDEEEHGRLDLQDQLLAEIMGGKFVPPMYSVLADDIPGETKACLDLGCGSGTWIIDVANRFPHVNAVAVDLMPIKEENLPPSLRCEVDDINLGLEHFYGDFDVVHARLISSGVKDYQNLLEQISLVVRPGGLIDISEFDFRLYDQHHRPIEAKLDQYQAPWWSQWMCYMRSAIRNIGGDTDAANYLYKWVSNNPRFEDVVYREFFIPAVPHKPDPNNPNERLRQWEDKMKDDVMNFLNASRPLLLGSGLPEEIMADLQVKCLKETEAREIPQFTKLQCVYARRKVD